MSTTIRLRFGGFATCACGPVTPPLIRFELVGCDPVDPKKPAHAVVFITDEDRDRLVHLLTDGSIIP